MLAVSPSPSGNWWHSYGTWPIYRWRLMIYRARIVIFHSSNRAEKYFNLLGGRFTVFAHRFVVNMWLPVDCRVSLGSIPWWCLPWVLNHTFFVIQEGHEIWAIHIHMCKKLVYVRVKTWIMHVLGDGYQSIGVIRGFIAPFFEDSAWARPGTSCWSTSRHAFLWDGSPNHSKHSEPLNQWIGSRENLQETIDVPMR
jgi:hypothetical protein